MGLVWELHTPSDRLLHLPVLQMMMLLKFGKAWQTLVLVMAWTLHITGYITHNNKVTSCVTEVPTQQLKSSGWPILPSQPFSTNKMSLIHVSKQFYPPKKWVIHRSKQFYPKGWVYPPSHGDVKDRNTGYNSIEIKWQRVIWVFFEGVRDSGVRIQATPTIQDIGISWGFFLKFLTSIPVLCIWEFSFQQEGNCFHRWAKRFQLNFLIRKTIRSILSIQMDKFILTVNQFVQFLAFKETK